MSALSGLIRRWETIHPYNFVDVVELIKPVEPGRLAHSAHATLEEMRGSMPAVSLHEGIDGECELARPFDENDAPVRIAYENRDATQRVCQRLGFTFRHASFDGLTALRFIRRALGRARGEALEPLAQMKGSQEAGVSARSFLRSVGNLLRMRRVSSRSGMRGESPRNAIYELPFDESLLDRLREEARGCTGATVNDVLLLRLAQGMRGLEGAPAGRRRETAIAVAASLDREMREPNLDVAVAFFPLFLGEEPPTLELVRNRSAAAKQTQAWSVNTLEMRFATTIWQWISRDERDRYLARNYVVTAGVTNVVTEWIEGVVSWRRAVSTGPVTPLVLSALTTGDRLALTLTWREARFLRHEIEAVARAVSRP